MLSGGYGSRRETSFPLTHKYIATFNGRQFTPVAGLDLTERNGVIRFETPTTTPTVTSGERVLFVNSSNQLIFQDGTTSTTLGGAPSGGTPSWETVFASDNTFTITPDVTFTIAGNRSTATDVLTVTNAAGGSGSAIQITNSGTGNDIDGTSNTWGVTAAGVATFAGLTLSGANTITTTGGDIDWLLEDNDTTALIIGSSGDTNMMTFDTSNAGPVVRFGDGMSLTDGNATFISTSNTVTNVLVTNNTITTFGADASSAGAVCIRSTSLTTGSLLQLQLSDTANAGGFYLTCRESVGGTNDFTIGENGVIVMTGTAGSDSLTITNGDVLLSDASLTMTDADNAASFSVTNNTATTASVIVVAGSGTFTGNTTSSFATLTASGLTSGTVLYVPAAALTTGKVLNIAATAATDGVLVTVTGGGANMTATGRNMLLDMGAATTGRALEIATTGAYTGAGVVTIVADSATTSGATVGQGVVAMSADALTTGTMLDVTSTSIVLTTGRLVDLSHISGDITGTLNKTADLVSVVSTRTVTTGTVADDFDMASFIRESAINGAGTFSATGSVLYVENAVTNTSGTVTDTANGVEVVMDSLGTGDGVKITHNATAGKALNIVSSGTNAGGVLLLTANSLTSNQALLVSATGTYTGTGIITLTATGMTSGSGVLITGGGANLTSDGKCVEIAMGAATAGAGLTLVTSGTYTGAGVVQLTANTATTGAGILVTMNGLTTGTGMQITSSGTITTTGELLDLVGNSATTCTGLLRISGTGLTDGFCAVMTGGGANVTASGGVLDITGGAATTGAILRVTTTGVYTGTVGVVNIDAASATTGTIVDVGIAGLTTGIGLNIGDANALTTGSIARFISNSADTGTRNLVFIHNDHASASGVTPLQIRQDNATSTNYYRVQSFTNGTTTMTIWMGVGTTGNGNLTGTAGDILINGGSNKPEYCTGTTNWTALV